MSSDEEYRRNTRIREEIPVRWQIDHSARSGEGLIRDISVSGVLIELSTFFTPDKNSVFLLTAKDESNELIIPDRARLIWIRPMKVEVGKYLCGMEFVAPNASIVDRLARHVEDWFVRMTEGVNLNILENYLRGRNRHE